MAMTIRLAVNETKALRELAARLGYIARDGRFAGEGSINKMMQAIARGDLQVTTNPPRALMVAADEAYKNEVVDTEMRDMTIGPGREYASKADWVMQRFEHWQSESASQID